MVARVRREAAWYPASAASRRPAPVLRRELPLGPRDALGRPPGRLALVDGPLEVPDGAVHVARERPQARAAAERVEILVERDHALVRPLGLRVLADLQLGVAEDPERVAVGGIQRDRLLRLGRPPPRTRDASRGRRRGGASRRSTPGAIARALRSASSASVKYLASPVSRAFWT